MAIPVNLDGVMHVSRLARWSLVTKAVDYTMRAKEFKTSAEPEANKLSGSSLALHSHIAAT